jgi:hypothetical protein
MFEWQRFLRLASAHWVEQRRAWAWFFALGIMVHFVVVLMALAAEYGYRALDHEGQGLLFYWGLFLGGAVFAARYFQHTSSRETTLVYVMRPASVLEKWLLVFLIVAVAYPLACTLAFQVCNLPASAIAEAQAAAEEAERLARGGKPEFDPLDYRPFLPWSAGLAAHDAFLLSASLLTVLGYMAFGCAWFDRAALAKTLLLAFLMLLSVLGMTSVFDSDPDLLFGYFDDDLFVPALSRYAYTATWVLVPALLWLAVYLVLKEKEAM